MRKLMLLCASLCAMAFVVSSKPAQAQVLAWVSPTGNNTGTTCSQTAPCSTFSYVIQNVASVAQINCLGSGYYGALNSTTVSITGSLVIDCGAGNIGEMTTNGGNAAINIDASSAATIVLRHLSLNGGEATGTYGIYTQSFASGTLIVEDCVITGFYVHHVGVNFIGGYGIWFAPSSGRGTLQVTNTLIYDTNNAAIAVSPASGQIASVGLEGDRLVANAGDGFDMFGSGIVAGTVAHSLIGENGGFGVSSGSSQSYVTVEETSIIDNLQTGVSTTTSGSHVGLGASTIAGNGTGVKATAGSLFSFGNNQLYANATNGTFTGTVPLE